MDRDNDAMSMSDDEDDVLAILLGLLLGEG